MTTFTTEDRKNASPPHIVDSGASVKTLADYIEQESREEMLRQQLHGLQQEIERLNSELIKYKILTSESYIYDSNEDNSVWLIQKKNNEEK